MSAVENEMKSTKQGAKSVTDFGLLIENLSVKLAASHVSKGTFSTESAAANIVQPVAVRSFIDGLENPTTKFFLKARNPQTLTQAISDALECSEPETEQMPINSSVLMGSYYPRFSYGNYYPRERSVPFMQHSFANRGYYKPRGNFFQNKPRQMNFRQNNDKKYNYKKFNSSREYDQRYHNHTNNQFQEDTDYNNNRRNKRNNVNMTLSQPEPTNNTEQTEPSHDSEDNQSLTDFFR